MAINDIKKFLDGTQGRLRIAHIQGAHGSGKSTKAVPVIWDALHGDDFSLVYIQATEAQTLLLRKYLLESSESILVDSVRNERLKLWSFTTAAAELLKGYEALDGNTIVCLDLEVAPTAYGQFLLACIIERAMQVHIAEGDNRLVLFTLGAGEHRYPTMEPFTNPTVFNVGAQRQMPEPVYVRDLKSLTPVVRSLAMRIVQRDRGLVVSFLYDPDLRVAVLLEVEQAFTFLGVPLRGVNLDSANMDNPTIADELVRLQEPGYTLVQVDPSITARLPFPHVDAVIYSLEDKTHVLDSYTGLYLWKTKLTSRPEVAVYRSYTASSADGHAPAAVALDLSSANTELETPRSRAYGSQLPLTVLLAFSKWKCATNQMPLAYLGPLDDVKWLDAQYLLKAMGLLKQTDAGWAPTSLGARTVAWLPHTHDWRVACFLGHIRPAYADLEKRVMIRLAAIIEHEVPINLLCPMSASLMKAIVAGACGPAPSMVDYGDIWVALSLWELVRRESDNFTKLDNAKLFDGRVVLKLGRAVYERVVALEELSKLQPATIDDMNQRLDAAQLERIELALADAWCSNMFWIKGNTTDQEVYARCFAHGDEVIVDTQSEAIYMDGLLDDGGCLATALSLRFNDDRIEAVSTILLDRKCARFIHKRMGNGPKICETFGSLWAHRCQVEK